MELPIDQIVHGDCLEVMKGWPDNCVDAVVTDPPYGVGVDYKSFNDTRDELRRLIDGFVPELRRISSVVLFTSGYKNMFLYPRAKLDIGMG